MKGELQLDLHPSEGGVIAPKTTFQNWCRRLINEVNMTASETSSACEVFLR